MEQTNADQLKELEKERAACYVEISKRYKVMSRFTDNWRLNGAQSGIDMLLIRTIDLTNKIDALRALIMAEWEKAKAENPSSKSPYD